MSKIEKFRPAISKRYFYYVKIVQNYLFFIHLSWLGSEQKITRIYRINGYSKGLRVRVVKVFFKDRGTFTFFIKGFRGKFFFSILRSIPFHILRKNDKFAHSCIDWTILLLSLNVIGEHTNLLYDAFTLFFLSFYLSFWTRPS